MFGPGRSSDAGRMTTETHAHTSACWWHAEEAHWVCGPGPGPASRTVPAARTPLDVCRAAVVDVAQAVGGSREPLTSSHRSSML